MNTERIYDMLVIGGGPAGYTAALYGTRAGFDTLVLEKLSAGGQMALRTRLIIIPDLMKGSTDLNWQKKCRGRQSGSGRRQSMLKYKNWI